MRHYSEVCANCGEICCNECGTPCACDEGEKQYPWTTKEIAKLAIYRYAMRAGFYNEDNDAL